MPKNRVYIVLFAHSNLPYGLTMHGVHTGALRECVHSIHSTLDSAKGEVRKIMNESGHKWLADPMDNGLFPVIENADADDDQRKHQFITIVKKSVD